MEEKTGLQLLEDWLLESIDSITREAKISCIEGQWSVKLKEHGDLYAIMDEADGAGITTNSRNYFSASEESLDTAAKEAVQIHRNISERLFFGAK